MNPIHQKGAVVDIHYNTIRTINLRTHDRQETTYILLPCVVINSTLDHHKIKIRDKQVVLKEAHSLMTFGIGIPFIAISDDSNQHILYGMSLDVYLYLS